MTFTGTIISAGDNDEGTPRLEIEVGREVLKSRPDSWLFKRVTITVEPPKEKLDWNEEKHLDLISRLRTAKPVFEAELSADYNWLKRQGKVCSRCGIRLGAIGLSLGKGEPEFCGPCMNWKLARELE